MKSMIVLSLAVMSTFAQAGLVDVDINTKNWTQDVAPSSGKNSTNTWKRLASNTPYRNGNLSGSLISDFTLTGDYLFSGTLQGLTHDDFSSSCSDESEGSCNDNDILGLVFGWQDADNHFRLGWSQGGLRSASDAVFGDESSAGLFLVQEQNGVSSLIHHWDNLFWQDDEIYNFNIAKTGNEFNIGLSGIARTEVGSESGTVRESADFPASELSLGEDGLFSFISSAFGNGNVGVYSESQMAQFTFDKIANSTITTNEVHGPATLSLFAMGLGLWQLKRRKTTKLIIKPD